MNFNVKETCAIYTRPMTMTTLYSNFPVKKK